MERASHAVYLQHLLATDALVPYLVVHRNAGASPEILAPGDCLSLDYRANPGEPYHPSWPEGIVAIYRLLSGSTFDPDAIAAMTRAYERVCIALEIVHRNDPLPEMIAKKIIERAKAGELDVVRLCEAVLSDLGHEP
jgi:hypothetical protein